MSTKGIILTSIAAIFVAVGFFTVSAFISYNNDEVALREQIEGQRKVIESTHDEMWKTINQVAQVSDEYKNAFDSIYTHIIDARYDKGDGTLMKWITESNPQFDSKLYQRVQDEIEIQRSVFNTAQKRMIDLIREHNTLCKTWPGSWFISNKSEIEYTVISSTKTKQVMTTGVDDDVNLY